MPVQRYDIYFSGKIVEDADPEVVKQKIANIFNASGDQLKHLFSGTAVKIKNGVDQDTAVKYRVAFRDAGALVEIRSADPVTAGENENKPASDTHTSSSPPAMTLLPPNTGSLADCAPIIPAAELPNIEYLSLAKEGTILDNSESAEPVQIDTSDLTLAPANTGSLAEYQITKAPAPLPDISQFKIVESND